MAPFASKLNDLWQGLSALQKRVVTASILAPMALIVIYSGGFLFAAMLIAAALVGYREWLALVQTDWPKSLEYTAYATLMLAILMAWLTTLKLALLVLFIGSIIVAVIAHLYMDRGDKRAPPWIFGGLYYLGLPMLALQAFGSGAYGGWPSGLMMMIFAIVWATDTFAYFAGRTFGGPKLAPKISPNKTWSGLIGGAMGAGATMVLFFYVAEEFDLKLIFVILAAVIGFMAGCIAQAGDLFESHVKRRAGVKDSGSAIPGHGGLLDRIDGLLTAAPFLTGVLWLLGWMANTAS